MYCNVYPVPISRFIPTDYVKSWIISGKRDAEENFYSKSIKLEDKKQHYTNNNLWNYLNK